MIDVVTGARQRGELRGHDIVVGANFEGGRNQVQVQGHDIVMDVHFEGGRNWMQVQNDGEGRDADTEDDGVAATEGGQVQGGQGGHTARLRRAPEVIMSETWTNIAQRTRQPRELFQAGTKKEVKRPGRGRKDR